MNGKKWKSDYRALPSNYRRFYDAAATFIPPFRLLIDPFKTLAFGTDASFYRLIPKIIIKTENSDEVSHILQTADRQKIPVTFRAAGTSLSGQAVTDSILVLLAGAWGKYAIHDNGERITLEPGILGAEANRYLAPFGRKIGPDPASINSCMIGGIAANNASGMCCGTAQNSYKTVESMKIIFADGTMLDTGDRASRYSFIESHKELIKELNNIRDEINGDRVLRDRIAFKYLIKNTTGYSINAFIDYSDPIDIILHLMIGSEGTLGFNAEITYRTVIEHTHKASALIIFPDIASACRATIILKKQPVAAVELMDRASLRSVENKSGLPHFLKSLSQDAAALLVETRAGDPKTLQDQMAKVGESLASIPTVFPIIFTDNKKEYENLWDVRRGLFPAVGGARKIGTTVIIEDVAFPIDILADATVELEGLMRQHGYTEGIIFGHALDGNLHFVFTQDFGIREEVQRYQRFMDDVAVMVVKKYDGSLKGEHGTGRNMAPFVEMEWGEKTYGLMRRIKKAFDPHNVLNPDVMISANPKIHLENLKPLPQTHDIVDQCIECGFCEIKCPSRNITATPRQRIIIQREISRLKATKENAMRLGLLEDDYVYQGEQTCAVDGLCATACPVSINTGELTKHLRSLKNTPRSVHIAQWITDHYPLTLSVVRVGLKTAHAAHAVIGTPLMSGLAKGLRALSFNKVPLWNPSMPKGISLPKFNNIIKGSDHKVVYFPSCISRTMGPAKGDKDQRPVFDAMLSVLHKADYDVLFPKAMERLCCGLSFESKGLFSQADKMSKELEEAVLACSNNGEYPVLCDTSPCLYRMRTAFKSKLKLYEPVEFIHDFLMDRLDFQRTTETVAVHVTCSSTKMGLAERFLVVAQACAEKVVIPSQVGCCGFAGDRGFTYPELNASALSGLKQSLPADCVAGYSNSRTCEIGLSYHSGKPYQSIVHLVDKHTSGKLPSTSRFLVPDIKPII
jgi:D-lactate dehydrogenase